MITIESKRLIFREMRESDVTDSYVAWMNDEEVVRFTESRFTAHTLESVREYIGALRAQSGNYFFAMRTKADQRHIGNIKIGPINHHHHYADIGLIIGDKPCWGHGYASEAIAAMRDWAFSFLKLHKLTAGAYATNKGSIRAFKKCGFTVEGIRKSHCLDRGEYVDCYLLGLLNSNHGS